MTEREQNDRPIHESDFKDTNVDTQKPLPVVKNSLDPKVPPPICHLCGEPVLPRDEVVHMQPTGKTDQEPVHEPCYWKMKNAQDKSDENRREKFLG